MKVIDLTHTIKEDMPVYPGTEKPSLIPANSYEKDGFKETRLSMFSHTGTHIDPPAHLFGDRKTLDEFPAEQFIGKAVVIDCRDIPDGGFVEMDRLELYGEKISKAEFLLFNFGWDKKWGTDRYFGNYPCIGADVIDFIINSNYKGIGIDVISLDPMSDVALERHNKLFSQCEIINIENLKNLDLCGNELFTFICLPIKIENSDGAPASAVAVFD